MAPNSPPMLQVGPMMPCQGVSETSSTSQRPRSTHLLVSTSREFAGSPSWRSLLTLSAVFPKFALHSGHLPPMFEQPGAKRVRREDLDSDDDDDSPRSDSAGEGIDLDLQARLNAQIAKALGMDVHAGPRSEPHAGPHLPRQDSSGEGDAQEVSRREMVREGSDGDLGEFDFRLFGTAGAPCKVVLEEHAEPLGGGALVRGRPCSYYSARNVSDGRRREYLAAAVTGDEVVERSYRPSWGMQLPWKVTRATVVKRARFEEGAETGDGKTRKRPGKKRRVAARVKAKANEERAEAEARKALDKEEHLKEKKKRINRLKKLRKRAKRKVGKGEEHDAGESDGE
ncbi:uncharacterized protein MAM_07976 [Metarhizium album ARSEF 1941]|uniref:DUF2011 domain-containing protein n=1 Tax=Metarhizium album (strain ARSEF 1941) TaxID=1081103 RepID=A0A0B2WE44_METAS|nr:uncharacterized protein MAM_07976 [Metarhizium album ARSEF 1941]KHN94136.1 hypothetical protein MAM_07976 [Metarhizium album ARSEF 1941]